VNVEFSQDSSSAKKGRFIIGKVYILTQSLSFTGLLTPYSSGGDESLKNVTTLPSK
jgi:hypothetical protein